MADGVAITAGAGTTVKTDDLGASGHAQYVKLLDGTNGGTDEIPGTAARGLSVDPRRKLVRVQVTPVVDTAVNAAKDNLGGLLTFANAVRASGGTGQIRSLVVKDLAQQMAAMDLVLFSATIAAPTTNAVFDPTDAELDTCLGRIPVATGDWADFNGNSVATVRDIGLDLTLAGTSLFGALVSRGTPTYATASDLVVTLVIAQD